jgi:hypothetical protein
MSLSPTDKNGSIAEGARDGIEVAVEQIRIDIQGHRS